VEASGEVVLPMQETTTEVLLDKMVVTTFPTSLKRRWSSSSNTMITSTSRIKISEEIILYFYPYNALLIILSLFTQCIIPKLA
jgi:hypothetical protein